jgi:hypothetical protein
LVVGIAVAGAGFLSVGYVSAQASSCDLNPPPGGCQSQDRAEFNSSTQIEEFLGGGLLTAGVGLGCVLIAAISLMAQWPPRSDAVAPPAAPPALWTPPPSPGNWDQAPAGGSWSPPGPGAPP